MTLYEVLNVKPGATRAKILSAYRKLAMKHHPDKGGNPDEFRQIANAYRVLSDKELRARYDQTGSYEEDQAEKSLAGIFMQAVESGARDPIAITRAKINEGQEQIWGNIKELTAKIERLAVVRKDIIAPEDRPDILAGAMDAAVIRLEGEMLRAKEMLALGERMLALLYGYSFKAADIR